MKRATNLIIMLVMMMPLVVATTLDSQYLNYSIDDFLNDIQKATTAEEKDKITEQMILYKTNDVLFDRHFTKTEQHINNYFSNEEKSNERIKSEDRPGFAESYFKKKANGATITISDEVIQSITYNNGVLFNKEIGFQLDLLEEGFELKAVKNKGFILSFPEEYEQPPLEMDGESSITEFKTDESTGRKTPVLPDDFEGDITKGRFWHKNRLWNVNPEDETGAIHFRNEQMLMEKTSKVTIYDPQTKELIAIRNINEDILDIKFDARRAALDGGATVGIDVEKMRVTYANGEVNTFTGEAGFKVYNKAKIDNKGNYYAYLVEGKEGNVRISTVTSYRDMVRKGIKKKVTDIAVDSHVYRVNTNYLTEVQGTSNIGNHEIVRSIGRTGPEAVVYENNELLGSFNLDNEGRWVPDNSITSTKARALKQQLKSVGFKVKTMEVSRKQERVISKLVQLKDNPEELRRFFNNNFGYGTVNYYCPRRGTFCQASAGNLFRPMLGKEALPGVPSAWEAHNFVPDEKVIYRANTGTPVPTELSPGTLGYMSYDGSRHRNNYFNRVLDNDQLHITHTGAIIPDVNSGQYYFLHNWGGSMLMDPMELRDDGRWWVIFPGGKEYPLLQFID